MSPEDIAALFANARENLAQHQGQPKDADLHALREVIHPVLLEIPYDLAEGKDNLIGLIADPTNYRTEYGQDFVQPTHLRAYPELSEPTNNALRAKEEAMSKAKLINAATCKAAERELRNFILDLFDETW